MSSSFDHLSKEAAELHLYARHDFSLLLGWFTFFCTSNYVALGAFSSVLVKEGGVKNGLVLYVVAGMFALQCALGFVACLFMKRHFSAINSRLKNIDQLVHNRSQDDTTESNTLGSLRLYNYLVLLMLLGLISFLVVWCGLIYVTPASG